MGPTVEMIDAIYREKVLRARRMAPERKLMAPARLYEHARSIAMAAIQNEHPGATAEEVRRLFQRRLRIMRELERGGSGL